MLVLGIFPVIEVAVVVYVKPVFTEQEENSALRSLDLMFNDILTDGAEILSKSLQVYICLSYIDAAESNSY